MGVPEPVLSAAERSAWLDLEVRLGEPDPVLAWPLRLSIWRVGPVPARLAALLFAVSVLIGVASVTGAAQGALAAALASMAVVIGINLNRLRRPH